MDLFTTNILTDKINIKNMKYYNSITKGFSDLPDEIILKIFSYLTPEIICFILPEVCKQWSTLYCDLSLWRNQKLTVTAFNNISDLRNLLARCPILKTLEICERSDVYVILNYLKTYQVRVSKLKMRYCELGKNEVSTLMMLLHHYPNLQALRLIGTDLWDTYSLHIISRFTQLRNLELGHTQFPVDMLLRRLIDNCHSLEKLKLPNVSVLDEDLAYITEHGKDKWESLCLNGGLTDNALATLSECSRLKRLQLLRCDLMTDEGLLNILGPITTLVSLKINRGSCFSTNALKMFVNEAVMDNLLELDLSYCKNVNDDVLISLAKKTRRLQYISIEECHSVTEQGLLKLLSCCPKLVYLDLLGVNNITGTLSFSLIPQLVNGLQYLNVVNTRVSLEAITNLLEDMPMLQVISTDNKVFFGSSVK